MFFSADKLCLQDVYILDEYTHNNLHRLHNKNSIITLQLSCYCSCHVGG